jgi:Flp pilus assembly protein TadG
MALARRLAALRRLKGSLPSLRLPIRLTDFLRCRTGIGAVEFALIAPFLFVLYLGGTEISMAVTINRKVEHTASTINDLVTQAQSLSQTDLQGIYQISTSLMAPYSARGLKIRVTSVFIDSNGVAKVDWSCPTTGMTKLAAGAGFTLPTQFAALRNRYILVAETRFPYAPLTTYGMIGAIEMGGTSYLDPRIGSNVASPSGGCTTIAL